MKLVIESKDHYISVLEKSLYYLTGDCKNHQTVEKKVDWYMYAWCFMRGISLPLTYPLILVCLEKKKGEREKCLRNHQNHIARLISKLCISNWYCSVGIERNHKAFRWLINIHPAGICIHTWSLCCSLSPIPVSIHQADCLVHFCYSCGNLILKCQQK